MGGQTIRTVRILGHPDCHPGWHSARRLAWPGFFPIRRMARHDAGQRRSLLVLCPAVAAIARPARYRSVTDPSDPPVGFRYHDHRRAGGTELRSLSFACFAFNGLQAVFIAYFVTYLTVLGYDLVAAGALFSTVIAIAIPCRILWGWVGSFYVAPRFVMSWLAFGMAGSVVLMAHSTKTWPTLAIGAVAGMLSATAMSWHGILLSESARLAPFGRAGAVTGGVLSFGQMGAFLCPSVFALLLRLTGGYAAGWAVCGLPAVPRWDRPVASPEGGTPSSV